MKRWSGITEERLLNTTTTLATIQASLFQIIDSDTILVGHSLECDLQALKLSHPHVIDTSVIYQHSRGPPYKPSLKWLAHKWLKRKIQDNAAGHDSAEDARTCIDLVKLKCQKGKEFGLFNIDTESLFTRFKRRGLDSAVVEYGDRGTAFYGDKVRTCVSVDSDSGVVDGVLESLETSHGFVWGRMKEVEAAAKWKDNDSPVTPLEEMAPVLGKFDANIQRLWDGLPACTALMVITGSGDPRDMSRLFAKRKLYEEEKKLGGDVQVQWMDADQQAYTLAVDKARTGLAFVAIK
jgi:RNA exonuclease 1